MLPYGDLRETKENIRRADMIIISKSPENISAIQRRIIVKETDKSTYQNLYFTSIGYRPPVPVFENNQNHPVTDDINTGIVLVTGIANPSPLIDYLKVKYKEIIHISFPDHHTFSEKDLMSFGTAYNNLKAARRLIFTTEKDAVRLREFTNIAEPIRSAFFFIPVGIHFLNEDKNEFDNLIIDYVRKNHRNNRFPEGQRDNQS
jgi:tetraacyldisaccharide 4'-kinase